MAIYRPASRRPLALAAAAALAAGLALGFVAGQASAPGLAASLEGLRERTAAVSSALEVLRLEYPKVVGGPSGDTGGADAALERARISFSAVEQDLALIDPVAAADAYRALAQLGTLVEARAPAAQVDLAIDDAHARLEAVAPAGGAP